MPGPRQKRYIIVYLILSYVYIYIYIHIVNKYIIIHIIHVFEYIYIYIAISKKRFGQTLIYTKAFCLVILTFYHLQISQPCRCIGIISKEQSLLLAIENSEGFGLQWAFRLRFAVQKYINCFECPRIEEKKNTTLTKKIKKPKIYIFKWIHPNCSCSW